MLGHSYDRPNVLRCNGCGAVALLEDGEDDPENKDRRRLPPGWEAFMLFGWVGYFHACCKKCRRLVEIRVERPEGDEEEPLDDEEGGQNGADH